jgi:hypothetical protein
MKKTAVLSLWTLGLMATAAALPTFADSVVYDNTTATSYTKTGWWISDGNEITNSFALTQPTDITGVDLAVWVATGDMLTSLDWAITSTSFGTVLASGTATDLGNVNLDSSFAAGFGYQIDLESFSISSLDLGPGTYWLQIENAVTPDGLLAAWDVSDGASVEANKPYDDPDDSDTFQILGSTISVTPEPSSYLLLGTGLLGLTVLMRRKLYTRGSVK